MPCPECKPLGTCIPCTAGHHEDCSDHHGGIIACACTHAAPTPVGPLGLPMAGTLRDFD